MFRFEQLDIWKLANEYTDLVYKLTRKFPKDELFSLTDQLRRSSNSIGANIAEGSATNSSKDFKHFLEISLKSTYETVSHLYRAKSNGYIGTGEYELMYNFADRLVRKIRSFQKSLR